MLAAATTSLFGKSSSLSAYTIHTTPTSTPSSSTLNLASTQGQASRRKPLSVGLWKVLSGTHKTTGKDVSVWIFEKRVIDGVRSPQLKEIVLETLRKEV
jgi:SCY1-like protein 2